MHLRATSLGITATPQTNGTGESENAVPRPFIDAINSAVRIIRKESEVSEPDVRCRCKIIATELDAKSKKIPKKYRADATSPSRTALIIRDYRRYFGRETRREHFIHQSDLSDPSQENSEFEFVDLMYDQSNYVELVEFLESKLSQQEKVLFHWRFIANCSYKEIAALSQWSISTVCRNVQDLVTKMRNALNALD